MGKGNNGLSGGGIEGRKNVNVGVKAGSRNTQKIRQGATSYIGIQVVGDAERTMLLKGEAKAPVRLGNDVALNVGKGGPGVGYNLHGQCGTQGTHSGGPRQPTGPKASPVPAGPKMPSGLR